MEPIRVAEARGSLIETRGRMATAIRALTGAPGATATDMATLLRQTDQLAEGVVELLDSLIAASTHNTYLNDGTAESAKAALDRAIVAARHMTAELTVALGAARVAARQLPVLVHRSAAQIPVTQ